MTQLSAQRKPMESPVSVAAHFLESLGRAQHVDWPYDHWLLEDALPDDVADAICALPFAPPNGLVFDGKRDTNNSTRTYFSGENQKNFPVCHDVVAAFQNPRVIASLAQATGATLLNGKLRIEYCQDIDGFWLEPHVDISVKLITIILYLSDDPQLADAGTDVYDSTPERTRVATSPYGKGKGIIFVPGKTTWHGFSKRPIRGVRKSIIINYVSPEWREKGELAEY